MSPRAGVPWASIHDYLLDVESATTRHEFLRRAVQGIERVIPWDTGIGLFSAHSGAYLLGQGLSDKANQDYNAYYRFHVPFLGSPPFPLSDEVMLHYDAVCWRDYPDFEYTTDFAKPNGLAYSLSTFFPRGRFVFAANRSRIGSPFRDRDCLSLSIITRHINNLYAFLDRAALAPESLRGCEEIADRFPCLSKREAEVLSLQNMGLTAPEIATKLFVSDRTIETHVTHIYEKLNVRSRREAISKVRGMDSSSPFAS
jgi:DNA-binding CsgD family transcriptional regulator